MTLSELYNLPLGPIVSVESRATYRVLVVRT